MRGFILIPCLIALITAPLVAQQMEDVVYLKNGSTVRGSIIEQIPGLSLKIQIKGGSVLVYDMDEIAEIARESVMRTEEAATGVEIGREPVMGTVESATGVEIGTLFGLSHLSDEDDGLTAIGVPGALGTNLGGNPALYVSWFPSETLSIGPEFSFGRISEDETSITSLYLGGRGAFFPQSNATSGVYILGQGSLLVLSVKFSSEYYSDTDTETDFSAGAGLGYQWRLGPAFVLRAEGRYRRWFDEEINNFSLLIGLGTRLGGR